MIYLKSNMELLRGNRRKAIKLLNTTPQAHRPTHETGEHVPTMYYNNLGVIHFNMQKHNLGAFYFRKSLHENTQIVNEFHRNDLSPLTSSFFTLLLSSIIEYRTGFRFRQAAVWSAAADTECESPSPAALQHGRSAAALRSSCSWLRLSHRDDSAVPRQSSTLAATCRVLHPNTQERMSNIHLFSSQKQSIAKVACTMYVVGCSFVLTNIFFTFCRKFLNFNRL